MLIVVQNAEDLLSERAYRAVIDGVAKEDLIYGVNGTGVRNEDSMFQWSTMQLQKLARDGKPVFAVEYLNSLDAARAARLELDVMGFRATFPTRALDGDDPFVTAEAGAGSPTPAKPEAGTPEYAATNCK
jgi:endo-alpha-1,4-polygalactosaminidase (GH114 family)